MLFCRLLISAILFILQALSFLFFAAFGPEQPGLPILWDFGLKLDYNIFGSGPWPVLNCGVCIHFVLKSLKVLHFYPYVNMISYAFGFGICYVWHWTL